MTISLIIISIAMITTDTIKICNTLKRKVSIKN